MYYAIGVSVPSLHRESTDSLISSLSIDRVRLLLLANKVLPSSSIIACMHPSSAAGCS